MSELCFQSNPRSSPRSCPFYETASKLEICFNNSTSLRKSKKGSVNWYPRVLVVHRTLFATSSTTSSSEIHDAVNAHDDDITKITSHRPFLKLYPNIPSIAQTTSSIGSTTASKVKHPTFSSLSPSPKTKPQPTSQTTPNTITKKSLNPLPPQICYRPRQYSRSAAPSYAKAASHPSPCAPSPRPPLRFPTTNPNPHPATSLPAPKKPTKPALPPTTHNPPPQQPATPQQTTIQPSSPTLKTKWTGRRDSET